MTTELDDALASEVGRAGALVEHLAHRLSDLAAGEPRELYALSIIAQCIHEKHALIREMAKALPESSARPDVPPKPPVSAEDKAMLSALIDDLQVLVLERPSVLAGLAALVRQLVLNRVA
jgi:hypothetical protein